MSLNISKGNMYDFVTHTWNTIKGACYHNCSYCYMKRWGTLKPARFDEKELKTKLIDPKTGKQGLYIFVGSSNDLFAAENSLWNIHHEWIARTLWHCVKYPDNKYLFQTKNPEEMGYWKTAFPDNTVICTTLESNRYYAGYMKNAPTPYNRALHFKDIPFDKYITIEPILDFGLKAFVEMIQSVNPVQVNIGADSGNNHLPEPSWDKILMLIDELSQFTTVKEKPNLNRLRA